VLRAVASLLVLAALVFPVVSAEATSAGDHVQSEASGRLVVTAPDGSVTLGFVTATLPAGESAPLPGAIVWCYAGFPTPCAPRADVPEGTTANGVWTVTLEPDESTPGSTVPYALDLRLAGWDAVGVGAVSCPAFVTVHWTLDWDARTATGACGSPL